MFSNDLTHAEEVVPLKVTSTGDFLSYNLTHFHESDPVHYNITINNKTHTFELRPSNKFFTSNTIVERRKRDLHTRYKLNGKHKNCHFVGKIKGKEEESKVALSTCNGLVSGIDRTIDLGWMSKCGMF